MDLNPAGPFAGIFFGLLYGVQYQDLVIPVCFSFWFLILTASLSGINLSDGITGGTYVGFAIFAAAIVILAIPRGLMPTEQPGRIVTVLSIAGICALGKWLLALRLWTQKLRSQQLAKRRAARGKAAE